MPNKWNDLGFIIVYPNLSWWGNKSNNSLENLENTIEVEGSGGRGLLHSIQQEHIWAANGKHITIRVEWSLLVGGTGLIYPTVGLWCPNSRPRRASSNSLSSSLSNKTKQTKQTQLLLDSLVQSMNQGWTGGTGGKSQANLATMEVPMKDFGAEVPGG
jgi:hypothetical protein